MKIKNTTAAILAAAAMTAATTAWAVDAAPASVPQITENAQPQVGMSAATAAAEEAYGGQTRSARLHMSREYGPVLDVRVVKDDGTNVHTFVDAQTARWSPPTNSASAKVATCTTAADTATAITTGATAASASVTASGSMAAAPAGDE